MMLYVVLVVDIMIHRQFLVQILHYFDTRPCILSRHIQGTYTSTNVQNNVSKILIVYVRTQRHGCQIYQLRVQLLSRTSIVKLLTARELPLAVEGYMVYCKDVVNIFFFKQCNQPLSVFISSGSIFFAIIRLKRVKHCMALT